jgi:hypothetical protein
MLAFIGLILNSIAVFRLWGDDGGASTFAIISGIASLWSYGIIINFRDNPLSLPTFWAVVSFASTVSGLILLIVSF